MYTLNSNESFYRHGIGFSGTYCPLFGLTGVMRLARRLRRTAVPPVAHHEAEGAAFDA